MSPSASPPFPVRVLGTTFQNPVLLAAGTAAFGREVDGVIDLDALGGIITKAVTPEPRQGHPAPRVAEFGGGMLNAVGLANPGLEEVARHELPWLAARLKRARVLVNVAGAVVDDYVRVVERLTPIPGSWRSRSTPPARTRPRVDSSSARTRTLSPSWCAAAVE